MSISHTPDNTSEVISARRTESLDAPNIIKLVTPSTELLFGRVNVVDLIEKSLLAVTLSNEDEDVLGHAAFLDYPNAADVRHGEWVDWLRTRYQMSQCNALNSMFMHYFVAKNDYSHGCAKEIIRTMFNAIPHMHHCLLLAPAGVKPDSALGEMFREVPKRESSSKKKSNDYDLYVCHRHHHVPVLHIREARVEDHDDLMPIFSRQTDVLTNTYGDYFVAELIEAQDDNMKCIVAEVDGIAVGFMSLCKDVNIDMLNDCFELGPFYGLRKIHNDDIVKKLFPVPLSPVDSADKTPSVGSVRSGAGSRMSHNSIANGEEEEEEEEEENDDKEEGRISTDDLLIKRKLSESQTSSLMDRSVEEMANLTASQRRLKKVVNGTRRFTKPTIPNEDWKEDFVAKYYGESNAFCIQLFCIDEKYEMRSCDFLPKAFELFGDRRYCVITVPHLVPEFPLLQHFVRVTPHATSTLSQELYIFNALGLLNNFTVRFASTKDRNGIENLVETLELHNSLLDDVQQYHKAHRDDDGTEIQVFVALIGTQVVGVSVIRREEDIEFIRSHFNIEDFIYFNHHRREEHGHLHHYALNPIFKLYSKHFLKEILRLGNKTSLYYPLYPAYDHVERHSLVAALSDMVPVRARRQIDYNVEVLGENRPSDRVLKKEELYALNHINRKLVLEPKVTINTRIVVVGASDVGIALLETFAFCPHLRFNNLTLVSPHGLPGEMSPDEHRDLMRATSHCYSQEEYGEMGLRAWVNVVYGKMTAIDRNKKHITVNDGALVPYDHLVLCTGVQYYVCAPTEADVGAGATNRDLPNKPQRRFDGVAPNNVFVVNDDYEAAVALFWIESNILKTDYKLVMYGRSLDTFTCVRTLLDAGLNGSQIILVEPPLSDSDVTCFNNPTVEDAVMMGLAEAGVDIHSGCILAEWNYFYEGEEISHVTFTTPDEPLTIECSAFFCYYNKMVDHEAFTAINCCCLVFDGRLVIDASFHTNDPSIRAAGPLTKYKRIYHADRWTHANYNSKEIGIQLASSMLTLFDPTLEPEPELTEDQLKLLPTYQSPKIQGAVLPGGYKYLHVEKPKLPESLEVLMNNGDYGRELVSGQPGGKLEYFRLHINQYNSVETITCLSKMPFSTGNFLCLYGLHQRYLNNLVSRFDEGLIDDFYNFFSENWAMAIYHDRFLDFRDEIRELLITRSSDDSESLEDMIRRMMEEDETLTDGHRKMLRERYVVSGTKHTVETRLLSFLTYNYYHLPMYAKPGMVSSEF